MLNKNQKTIILFAVSILLVPLIAMQFTNEVNWGLLDFIAAAILLICMGLLCEFSARKATKPKYKVLICVIIIVILLLIWAELAVGILR